MRSATLPPIRVEPELRAEAESLLREGESLSEFLEKAVRDSVRHRREQAELVTRSLVAVEAFRLHHPARTAPLHSGL